MALESRFEFPNFILTGTADTPTHEVQKGTIDEEGTTFLLELIRSRKMPHGNFLIGSVKNANGGKVLWRFPKGEFDGIGILVPTKHGTVIALLRTSRDGKVERVIPLSVLATSNKIGLHKQIEMKAEVAEWLGREVVYSSAEHKVMETIAKRKREAQVARLAAERAEEERAKLDRKHRREERRKVILARAEVHAFTADGRHRKGLPVLENEWATLEDRRYCILVETIGEDGTLGAAIEAFIVEKKEGGNPRKKFRTPVTFERPTEATAAGNVPRPIEIIVVEMDENSFEEVLVFDSMDVIREAKGRGLNGGTLVSPANQQDETGVMVYRIAETIETIGKFAPL